MTRPGVDKPEVIDARNARIWQCRQIRQDVEQKIVLSLPAIVDTLIALAKKGDVHAAQVLLEHAASCKL